MSDNHTSEKSERKLGVPMLVTLTFSAYVLLAVLSTTDMMLLREGVIILPFIQIGVPVVTFYIIAPLLIIFLHLNVLGRLIMLARGIYKRDGGEANFDKKARSDDGPPKAYSAFDTVLTLLFPTDPERLMSAMREATPVTAFLSIAFLIQAAAPLLVLLILQARFLAYQDEGITLYHQSIITLDLFIQLMFTLSYIKLWGREDKLLHTSRYIITSVLFTIPTLFVWTVALIPDSSIEKAIKFNLQESIAGCFFPDWWKEYRYGNVLFQCDFFEGERFINIQNEIITLRNQLPETIPAIIQARGGSTLELPCEHTGMLNLSGRRLLYANFSNSKFNCVEMNGTQLNGSNLASVNLSTVSLTYANLSKANFYQTVLRGSDLSQADLSEANLWKTDLREANLRGADLSEANLREANLRGADLSEANLRGAALSEADLVASDLSGADLRRTNLRWTNLRKANLRVADLSGVDLRKANLSRVDLRKANLRGVDMRKANLRGIDLSGANLSRADLRGVDLSKADLGGADLGGADLGGAELDRADQGGWADLLGIDQDWADLSGANLHGAILYGAILYGANVSEANLSRADLSRADLSRANLSGANLSGANLSGANLNRANLYRANLSEANLIWAKLRNTDLSSAKMYGAVLYEAQLDGIELEGAKLYGANFSGSRPRDTSLGKADEKKLDKDQWVDILDNIKSRQQAEGYSERGVDAWLRGIKRSAASTLGYVLPTGTDHCVLYDDEPEWNLPPELSLYSEWNLPPKLSVSPEWYLPPECVEAERSE